MSAGSQGSFPEEVSGERSSRGWAGPGGGWEEGVLGRVSGMGENRAAKPEKGFFFFFFFFNIFPHGNREPLKAVQQSRS